MKYATLLLFGALTACSAAATNDRATVTSFASPQATFRSYRTFSFGLSDQPKPGYSVTPRSLEVQRRLRPLVLDALRAHGYTNSEAEGDFVIKLATGTGSSPFRGRRGAVSAYDDANARTTVALGYIGINVYDRLTGTEVWQGTAFAEVDLDKIDDSLIKSGVRRMLANFPTRHATGYSSDPSVASVSVK